ncbi:MAG: exodeoxyribonuclease III [bacterium]
MKKIISWNVNGVRACIKKGLLDFLVKEKPDVLGMQEIKANLDQISGKEFSAPAGYQPVLFPAEKPGYSGVGAYIKQSLECKTTLGLGVKEFDKEGRSMTLELDDMIFVNAYFPNSQEAGRRLKYKLDFCEAIKDYLDKLTKKGKPILVSGDYNIAHKEIDLARPKDNEDSPGFLPEERAWMDKFLAKDYFDTFRIFNEEPGNYTWWSMRTNARSRNVGWRIDYHCVNKHLKDRVVKSYHNTDVLGSDHCPITIMIKGAS